MACSVELISLIKKYKINIIQNIYESLEKWMSIINSLTNSYIKLEIENLSHTNN